MEEKSFTQKVTELMLNGGMPHKNGYGAEESGLVLLHSDATAPVVASYGSSNKLAAVLVKAMEQNEGIRLLITGAIGVYSTLHPDDTLIQVMKRNI